MIQDLTEIQILQLITTIVGKHRCRIIDMDLKNRILNIDGAAEDRVACAEELTAFLE